MNNIKKYFLLFGVALAVFAISTAPFIAKLDLGSTDLFVRAHFPQPDVAILAIDDKSITSIGRWPWPRSVEANVLNDLDQYSPLAVGIDIDFSDAEDTADDAALAASMRNAAFPIVLPVEPTLSNGATQFLYPLALFQSLPNVSLGHVGVALSADGNARLIPPADNAPTGSLLPFAEEIASRLNTPLPNASTMYAINFAGPAGTFPTYSISDFLDGAIPAAALQGKIILIGATASDLHDIVSVPLGNGVMAGVEWHANILDNLLLDRAFVDLPPFEVHLAGFILALIVSLLFMRVRARNAFFITLAAVIVVPLVSYLAIQKNLLIPYFGTEIFVLAAFGQYGIVQWYTAEKERRRIRRTVQNYFSPAVLDVILKNPKSLTLGGERKEVTILFSDIRSFTTITESLPPEQLSNLLHEYFTEMAEEIFATDGVLDKFIGDAIMAFWGAPIDQPDHADRAVQAARGMMRRLAVLQEKWKSEGLPFVDIGIGIHTGEAVVGNMGSEKRFDYTVIGDSVNAASRLEGLNKEYKTHIIISDVTKEKVKKPIATHKLGDVMVKGKTRAITIYSVAGE